MNNLRTRGSCLVRISFVEPAREQSRPMCWKGMSTRGVSGEYSVWGKQCPLWCGVPAGWGSGGASVNVRRRRGRREYGDDVVCVVGSGVVVASVVGVVSACTSEGGGEEKKKLPLVDVWLLVLLVFGPKIDRYYLIINITRKC